MKTKLKVAFVAVLAVSLITTAIAAIVVQRQIQTTLTIRALYDMEILDEDITTILTSIDFGVLYRGNSSRYPGPGLEYGIKNTGQGEIWLSYNLTNWPTGVTFTLTIYKSTPATLAPGAITSFSLNTNEKAYWYIDLTVGASAPFGTYTPTLTLRAHDSAAD